MTSDGKIAFEITSSLGLACLALVIYIRHKESVTLKWPQVSGKIVTSTTRLENLGRGRRQVVPIIEYEFAVNGKLCRSSHWRFANFSIGQRSEAETIAARYSVGKEVIVYANLGKPEKSVLEHGRTSLSWIPLAFTVLFFALSVLAAMENSR